MIGKQTEQKAILEGELAMSKTLKERLDRMRVADFTKDNKAFETWWASRIESQGYPPKSKQEKELAKAAYNLAMSHLIDAFVDMFLT